MRKELEVLEGNGYMRECCGWFRRIEVHVNELFISMSNNLEKVANIHTMLLLLIIA